MRAARLLITVGTLAAGIAASACDGDDDFAPAGVGRVELRIATRPAIGADIRQASGPTAALIPSGYSIRHGADEIVLESAGLVLRKVELEGDGDRTCDETDNDAGRPVTAATACAELRTGPILAGLPLLPGPDAPLVATVPAGRYDVLRFQIHRPVNATADLPFIQRHPEYRDVSVRLTGTYQAGAAAPVRFTYTTGFTGVFEVRLPEPVRVEEGNIAAITLAVDLEGWFADPDGDGLIDPRSTEDPATAALVELRIRESFRAFSDPDADGTPD